jgi:hypothetical protein
VTCASSTPIGSRPSRWGPQLLREVASKGNAIPYTTWVGEGVEQRAMSIAARPFRISAGPGAVR